MIWIDSSFAIEWLSGTDRAKEIPLKGKPVGILPMQYLETLTFFLKRDFDPSVVVNQLEAVELQHPSKVHLQRAAFLYQEARRRHSKASLADAVLAAVAHENKEKVASFDQDFASLGLTEKGRLWVP